MMKYWFFGLFALAVFPLFSAAAPVVLPGTATPGSRAVFTISVISDRSSPLSEVRLFVPRAVTKVTPSVKQGWAVEIVAGGPNELSEIAWRGGPIPPGYRDEFSFEASVGEDAERVKWIILEGYKDGTIASFDGDPAKPDANPAPTTLVVKTPKTSDWYGKIGLFIASFALFIGIASLLKHF